MISFLISLAPYLPVILQLMGLLFQWFGASQDTMKEYEAMVKRCNDAGLLSVQSHDRLIAHRDAILERLKAKSQPKP